MDSSHRIGTGFAGADADYLAQVSHKNFAITHLSGLGFFHDCLDDFPQFIFWNNDFHFNFRNEVDGIFIAPIHLGVPLLATEPFDFRNRHAFDTTFGERVFDFIEFEVTNNRFDFLHYRSFF